MLELLTDEKQSRVVNRYSQKAVGFIRTNKEKPFFPLPATHRGLHADTLR